jgi:hypothetical protein
MSALSGAATSLDLPAVATHSNLDVCPREGNVEVKLDYVGERRLAELAKTLVVPVKGLNVALVPVGPWQSRVEPKVGGVGGRGLFDVALLKQEGGERMARRLHSTPRLRAGEVVRPVDGLA